MQSQAITLSLLVAFMWSLLPLIQKTLLKSISVEVLMVLGGVAYAVLLVAFFAIHRKKVAREWHTVNLRVVGLVMAIGALAFVPNIIFLHLLSKHESYIVTALTFVSPVFTAALAYLFLKENVTWASLAGVVLIVAGVMLLAWQQKSLQPQ